MEEANVIGPEQIVDGLMQTRSPNEIAQTVYGLIGTIEKLLGVESGDNHLEVVEAVKRIEDEVARAKVGNMGPNEVLNLASKLDDLYFYLRVWEAAQKKLRGQG